MLVVMHRLLILLLLIYCSTLPAAVYKWVDEAGRVHYSDQPAPGAEEIKLPEPSVYTPRSVGGIGGMAGAKGKKSAIYQSFSITSPANQATFRTKEAQVTAKFSLTPRLRPGHAIRLTMDGRVVSQRLTRLQLDLGTVSRGSHRLQATVIDKKGQQMISASPVQFFVHIDAGDASEAAESGSSDDRDVDAPQYEPDDPTDFENSAGHTEGRDASDFSNDADYTEGRDASDFGNDSDYTKGRDASDFQTPANPSYAPQTPGTRNPAFTPSY
ncbi:MAG: DUF4124 domain-containing protein [Candidatus Sedimenticola sp. (ex Thyasira tokunagai)]